MGPKQQDLAAITERLIGKPYSLGGADGFDCFSLIVSYVRSRGGNIPSDLNYKGHTLQSYPAEYLKDKSLLNTAIEYLSEILAHKPVGRELAGDILVYQIPDRDRCNIGIDAGNGYMIVANEQNGVCTLHKEDYKIVKVLCLQK